MRILLNILSVICSLLLIVAGVTGLFVPSDVFMTLATFLPYILLISGITSIVFYFSISSDYAGSSYILFDGLINLLFSVIFFVMGVEFSGQFIVLYVAFMCMFRGVMCIALAFDFRRLGSGFWIWNLLFGIANAVVAVLFVVYPQVGGITIGVLFSLTMLFFGLAWLIAWIGITRVISRF